MAKKLYTNEEIAKKMQALPDEVKDLLYSFEMTSAITKAGEKSGLHIDQMDRLNTEAGYVMMGLTDTKDFPAIIAEDLGIDDAKAQAVAKDIDEMLFSKVRTALQKPSAVAPAPASPMSQAATTVPLSVKLPLNSISSAPAPQETVPLPVKIEVATPKPEALIPKPEPKAAFNPADTMLNQQTVAKTPEVAIKTSVPAPAAPIASPTQPKAEPPKPQNYKTDPYREPTN